MMEHKFKKKKYFLKINLDIKSLKNFYFFIIYIFFLIKIMKYQLKFILKRKKIYKRNIIILNIVIKKLNAIIFFLI